MVPASCLYRSVASVCRGKPLAPKLTGSVLKAGVRSRGKLHTYASSNPVPARRTEQSEKQTVGGGGYNGYCDIDDIKRLRKECEGLKGAALEACWADAGCDIEEVTRHYATVAGIEQDEYRVYVAADGSLVADGLPTGEYRVSAWWAGVKGDEPMATAPACSPFTKEDCMTVCHLVGEFDLVCPGLGDGKYHITSLPAARSSTTQ